MGIFLLLQASPVRNKLPEASAVPTAGISNGASSFAQESGPPILDVNPVRNPSLPSDSAISNGAKEETADTQKRDSSKKAQYRTTPEIKGYTYNIKRLLEQIEENLQRVDEEIKEAEIRKRNEEREAKVIEYFERGNAFYKEGKLKEAKKEWQRALKISKDPEMKDYIKKAEKRAREEELARKKEEKERQRRLEAEQREKERRLNEQAKVFYEEAVSLYKSKNYEQAQVKFEEASQIIPHYSKTDYYLNRIPEDIERQRQHQLREKIQILNKEGRNLYRNKNYDEAAAKFKEVLKLDPENKIALRYSKLIPKRIEEEKKRLKREKQR